MIPANVPLAAWRNARHVEDFTFTAPAEGGGDAAYDLTGWSAAMQVRLYGAAPDDPVISLANVTSDSEGVWIVEPAEGLVRIRIDETTLAAAWNALGGGVEAGDPIRGLRYDLVLTPPAGGDEVWIEGEFTLYPGVTV